MRLARLPLLVLTTLPAVASLASVATGCGGEAPPPETPAPAVASAPPPAPTAPPVAYDTSLTGVDANALDRSVSPCDDFYQFACGGWMKNTPIPDDQSRWVRSFSVIAEDNKKALRAILERDAAGNTQGDAYGKQLGDFWASCMDEDGIEKRGASDLKPELKLIDGVHDGKTLVAELAHLHQLGVGAGFDIGTETDVKDSAHDIATINQGGLGLPERDYYFRDDARAKDIRAAYEAHVAATLALIGEKPKAAAADAKTVLKIETALADASMKRVDMRDPQKVYHHTTIAELKAMAPTFGWDGYFGALGFPGLTAFNVAEPDFVKKLDAMTKSVPMAQWKTYLRWHLARAASPLLSKAFVDEWFKFSQVLRGTKSLPPRWKRCVDRVDEAMGEALAQPFVKAYLGEDGKQTAAQMVAGIEASMKADLDGLTWMDDATRAQAEGKLAAITNKIGYPAQWRNYDAMTISRASLLANVGAGAQFELARQLKKAGQPVDKGEWGMTPPTVNAYYNPAFNEMVFPAGILQPPFYASTQAPAVNFGAIGMVVGHELTHGFDDEGRQFDAQGNLRDWWSPSVSAEFDRRAACVEKQYDDYVAVDDLHVKGKLTLGENLADLGGMKLAYTTFERTEKEHPATPPSIGGFTPQQTFFLGFAQGWCTNARPEELRLRVQTDPHSPAQYRVDGPLSNLPEFASAFACKAGDKMVRGDDKRCVVW
jgi:endothelin-converting enzyme/putative endopeptidase